MNIAIDIIAETIIYDIATSRTKALFSLCEIIILIIAI